MKKVRVILWRDCYRDCNYCCNNYKETMKDLKTVTLDDIKNYDEVMLSGGEPMLYPDRLLQIISIIKYNNPKAKIYLYSTYYKQCAHLINIINQIDGIHYSIHENATTIDIQNFQEFQEIIEEYQDKSFRLYINPDVNYKLTIIPYLWTRIEMKDFLPDGSCPVPEDDFFELIDGKKFQERRAS